jgi:PhoPQ-activated pathogenicity-related protein
MKLNDVYDYYGGNWAFAMRELGYGSKLIQSLAK